MALVIGAFMCFVQLAPFGSPLMSMGEGYLKSGAQTGAANHVTAVLLDFRAYDTLGEATVIFAAVIGCYALLRTRGRESEAPPDEQSSG